MNNQQRIEIAKAYISRHKIDNVEAWKPYNKHGDAKYLAIYNMLINGAYGEARCLDDEYDEDGNITKFGVEYECEISGFHTKTGAPYVFTWEDDDYSQAVNS